jgi:hypothetical protein
MGFPLSSLWLGSKPEDVKKQTNKQKNKQETEGK